ncbi:MAG: hypothetical protein PHF63_00980 [Herbinix sp.]|nr:hypothetical protein [Herbinix sp.]
MDDYSKKRYETIIKEISIVCNRYGELFKMSIQELIEDSTSNALFILLDLYPNSTNECISEVVNSEVLKTCINTLQQNMNYIRCYDELERIRTLPDSQKVVGLHKVIYTSHCKDFYINKNDAYQMEFIDGCIKFVEE